MSKFSVKAIGHVEASEMLGKGYIAKVYRYGSGRKLPFARILLQANGLAFQSRAAALAALETWKRNPRDCKHLAV